MNRNTSDLTVEELGKIVAPTAIQYNIRRVFLFGSRARGDYRPYSDYDFCILPGEHCSMLTLGGLITDLKDGDTTLIWSMKTVSRMDSRMP